MSYTARSVSAACAPWPLVIGRHTYTARPLSAALVLRVLPALARPESRDQALHDALRAAFVAAHDPWYVRLWRGRRDPVRAILRLDSVTIGSILKRLFTDPGASADAETDPAKILIAAHRRLSSPSSGGASGPSLALAALTCEVTMGASWYFNWQRWPTTDGYAPLALVLTTYQGLMAIEAKQKLAMQHAMRLAQRDGPVAQRGVQDLADAAYPTDPTAQFGVVS